MKLFGWLVPWWAYGIAAALLALALWQLSAPIRAVFDWFNDREAVAKHEAKVTAQVTETVLEAERAANRNEDRRRVIRDRQADELDTAIDEAAREYPDETSLPAGPAVRAVLGELQRQAGEDRSPAS